MLLNLLLQAGETMAADAAAPVQIEKSYSILEMASKGGWLMWVLLLLSIIALYIFGKKLWMIRAASKIESNFINDIKDYVADGKIKSAKTLCRRYNSPVARMTEAGLNHLGKQSREIQSAVENVANMEVSRLEKGLPYLATISCGAPMIGFLGTVIGMVQAFFNMAQAGSSVDISLLSGGIYTAMITTVGGLIVGILAFFGYNILTAQISNIVFKMESASIELLDALAEQAEAAPAAAPAAADVDIEIAD